MIALDTNVLVRFLVDDDRLQADIANELVNHADGVFIAKTVLLELEWVLRQVYEFDSKTIGAGLLSLLGLPTVTVESAGQVAQALRDYAKGMDFADALHLASNIGGALLYTFDKKFAKSATANRARLASRKSIPI